jgi:glycine hydroxymethyltransferase
MRTLRPPAPTNSSSTTRRPDPDGPRLRPAGAGRKGTLSQAIQRAVFPFFQGTPNLSAIAAKARALDFVATPEFAKLVERIVAMSVALGRCFHERGYRVLTGGTDNHMVLIDVLQAGITGVIAEKALETCNIVVNKNRIPGDTQPPLITSGMRLGTNTLAARGMTPATCRTVLT